MSIFISLGIYSQKSADGIIPSSDLIVSLIKLITENKINEH